MWIKFRSLRSQFLLIILGITVSLVLIMGFLDLQTVTTTSTRIATMSLNWQAQRTSAPIQSTLTEAKDMTDALARSLEADIDDPGALRDPAVQQQILDHLEKQFHLSAESSSTIFGYYLQFNSEYTGHPNGFWYTWDPERKAYVPHTPEEMGQYFYKDRHLRKFFQDLRKGGQPVWRPPYNDHNFAVRRISYVVPVYKNQQFVGFVGLSIRMDTLISMIRDARIYESGYAVLFSNEGELYYHPDYPEGAPTTLKDFGLEPYAEVLKGRDSNDQLLSYHYKGQEKELAFITLRNSMNLGIIAPDEEIYEERRISYGRNLFLMVFFGLITSGMAIAGANRIIQPLKEIDEAARRMGQGKYDTLLHSTQKDEVGDLARNMDQTMLRMKEMVDRLENQALEDNLTQVKNTRAYQLKVQELDGLIRKDPAQVPSFGVLMVDVNDLKGVNDRYGHARGNDLLLRTVKYICDLFKHSPVYRVGGDEFVVILQKEDYHNREAILSQLKPWNRKRNYEDDRPWDQLAFASGFSAYDPENDINFLHVFLRADAVMYENKKKAEGNRMR